MDRLERLTVHVEEAIRLGTATNDAHLRLGLMLLDSAAELLMHRQCRNEINSTSMWAALLKSSEEIYARTGTDEAKARVDEARARTVSNTKRKRIDREFDAKCDFLHEKDLLADPQVRVLKKLHEYRNETYHRDKLRRGVLASAAKIYLYLLCTMMRDFPVNSMSYPNAGPPAGIAKYIGDSERVGFDMQAKIGAHLLEASGLATQRELGLTLGRHIHARLDELADDVEFIASWYRDINKDESWDLEAVLGLASLRSPTDYRYVRLTADSARTVQGYKPELLDGLRELADGLSGVQDQLSAFSVFANIEDIFEPLEAKIRDVAIGLTARFSTRSTSRAESNRRIREGAQQCVRVQRKCTSRRVGDASQRCRNVSTCSSARRAC